MQNINPFPSKRQAIGPAQGSLTRMHAPDVPLRDLVETTARLSLSTAASVRQLRAVSIRVALLPQSAQIVIAGKEEEKVVVLAMVYSVSLVAGVFNSRLACPYPRKNVCVCVSGREREYVYV